MAPLNLQFKHDDEIVLPIALLASSLSNDEIVALELFMAISENMDLLETFAARLEGTAMKAAGTSLQAKGIVKVSMEKNRLRIEVDLDAAIAADKQAGPVVGVSPAAQSSEAPAPTPDDNGGR